MQEYKIKNNGTKIEAFQQQVADATYTLPMYIEDSSKFIRTLINTKIEVKQGQWIVKYTSPDGVVHYLIINDKEFREKYEAVSAPAPHPLKNASQELQETLRRLEEDFVKTPWHERDRPQKFWLYDEINNPGRYPYRSAPIWMCEHGLCEKFGQQ